MKPLRRLALALALAASTATAATAHASFRRPADAVHYRRATLLVMAHHTADLGAMLRGATPFDVARARLDAHVIQTLAGLPWPAFGPGTDVAGTQARPAVWTDHARFLQDASRLQQSTPQLVAAAQAGSIDQLRAAFSRTVKTCKACHDSFRH